MAQDLIYDDFTFLEWKAMNMSCLYTVGKVSAATCSWLLAKFSEKPKKQAKLVNLREKYDSSPFGSPFFPGHHGKPNPNHIGATETSSKVRPSCCIKWPTSAIPAGFCLKGHGIGMPEKWGGIQSMWLDGCVTKNPDNANTHYCNHELFVYGFRKAIEKRMTPQELANKAILLYIYRRPGMI